MHGSKLKISITEKGMITIGKIIRKQQNFCVSLLRQTENEYFQILNIRFLLDNRNFWKKIKPCFDNKGLNSKRLFLVSNKKQLAFIMNKLFIKITKD